MNKKIYYTFGPDPWSTELPDSSGATKAVEGQGCRNPEPPFNPTGALVNCSFPYFIKTDPV